MVPFHPTSDRSTATRNTNIGTNQSRPHYPFRFFFISLGMGTTSKTPLPKSKTYKSFVNICFIHNKINIFSNRTCLFLASVNRIHVLKHLGNDTLDLIFQTLVTLFPANATLKPSQDIFSHRKLWTFDPPFHKIVKILGIAQLYKGPQENMFHLAQGLLHFFHDLGLPFIKKSINCINY